MRRSLTALQYLSAVPGVKGLHQQPSCHSICYPSQKAWSKWPILLLHRLFYQLQVSFAEEELDTQTKGHPLAFFSIKFLSLVNVSNHTINKKRSSLTWLSNCPHCSFHSGHKGSGITSTAQAVPWQFPRHTVSKSAGILLSPEDPAKLIHYRIMPQ